MRSINKVILIGNLGSDPDVRTMQSGDKVANLRVATSESWKDKNTGELKEKTEWHNVVVFNQNIISFVESYASKGEKVYIEGQLETRKWTDQSGQDRYTTEIVLRPYVGELILLNSRSSKGLEQGTSNSQVAGSSPAASAIEEDEIPF